MRDENELSGADAGDGGDDGADDLVIRRAARELQAPLAFGAGFDARVMAAVRAAAADDAVERRAHDAERALPARDVRDVRDIRDARGLRRAWGWVVRPRTLRVSPLAGLAAAAALAFVMVQVADEPVVTMPVVQQPAPPAPVGAVPASLASNTTVQQVQFVLVAPSARSVALVGDFNDWSAAPLTPVKTGGAWTITVPLAPGRYTYNFVVDGNRVMPDPAAPEAPADDFGTPASVVTVAGVQS